MEPTQIALDALALARTGRFDELREMFPDTLRPMVAAEALRTGWKAAVDNAGGIREVGTPLVDMVGGTMLVKIPITLAGGAMTVQVAVAGDRVAGLNIVPGEASVPPEWTPPPYADPDAFEEREVTVGAGPLAVGGTLTLPRSTRPGPAVVFLGGSGPGDRDETIGRTKAFRDLAGGLASLGVATLRFDKATRVHPDRFGADITIDDEYATARDAVALLRTHPAVDRVFLAGHSLGGTVAPRLAAADPPIAGLLMLAAGAEPMHRATLRQIRHLAAQQPGGETAAATAIEALTRQVDAVDSPDLSPDTPASELPFGAPAAYWLSVRDYDPVAAAAALPIPMLFVQGGRDYQVTVADDLDRWRAGLAGRGDVTFRVYPDANHALIPGPRPSTPAEYEHPGHVDPTIVADIAAWLTGPHPPATAPPD